MTSIQGHAGLLLGSGISYRSLILSDTPHCYWPLNDTSSPAIDIVSGINATFPSGVIPNEIALYSALGSCFSFPGTNPNHLSYTTITLSNTASFECWFKITGASTSQALMSMNFPNDFSIDLINGTPGPTIIWGGTGHATANLSYIPNNVTHHLVATLSASGNFIYIDGILRASSTDVYPGSSSGGVGIIGARNTSFTIAGYLSNLALYTYTLTSAQVLNHYNAGNH